MQLVNTDIICGKTREHLVPVEGSSVMVHHRMLPAWQRLRARAVDAGFDLRITSSFRDFDAQLKIWNEKATGKRALLDAEGNPLDFTSLSPEQIVYAILRWSALPGASRHHWGTDVDVYDFKALPPDYHLQLIPAEVNEGGMFAPLHDWLDRYMWEEGFFRPYEEDRGGVSPERWHLSYAPVSQPYLNYLTEDLLVANLATATIELKSTLTALLPDIYSKYIKNICLPVW